MTTADPTAQANVERSLTFRREYYKYALGLATALLAFSVTIQPLLSRAPVHLWLLIPTWLSLGLAFYAGLRLHLIWAKFLVTYSDHRTDRAAGNRARGPITASRRFHDGLLVVTLALGAIGIAAFAALNLTYIAPKTEAAADVAAAPAAVSADVASPAQPVVPATEKAGG
ncbi:MAG TPA: hypothetical protein DIV82_03810 [Brevundimonas diminuta]|nr:hypothetical protein [Brevundimonas diminuta]